MLDEEEAQEELDAVEVVEVVEVVEEEVVEAEDEDEVDDEDVPVPVGPVDEELDVWELLWDPVEDELEELDCVLGVVALVVVIGEAVPELEVMPEMA